MNINMTKLILIYGLLILINACVTRGASHDDLNGKWKLAGYNFTPNQEFAIEKMTVFVSISDNKQIGGKSGCNLFGGDLTIGPGRKLKVGTLISTEMFCDETTGQFESLFTATLENATEYSLENGVLTFSNPTTKDFLSFQKAPDEKPLDTPSTEERLTFFVRNRLVNCDAGKMKCLQIKNDKDSVWHVMREPVTGFDFKPGRFYKIEVLRERAKNEPGKPSYYRYQLGRVIKSVRSEKDLYK
ncbi:MAG: META domain-containing protein [Pyrinomonadaceae bacterium]